MKPKTYLIVSFILCGISVVSAGLAMFFSVATPNTDYRNSYITSEGSWTHAPLDLQDQQQVRELARSVGAELRQLRETRRLVVQSSNWDFIAGVAGVLAAISATLGLYRANKSVEPTRAPEGARGSP